MIHHSKRCTRIHACVYRYWNYTEKTKGHTICTIDSHLSGWAWKHWENADAYRTNSHGRGPRIIQYICIIS